VYGGTTGNSQGSRKFDKGGLKLAKYHVGIDVSKHKHKACIRNLAQDSYSGVFSFDVNRQGFEKFSGTLEKFSQNKEDFVIGIEATGNYGVTLAYFLLSHGYKVVEINPYRANQFRKAQGKKAKTDRIDARSLAALLSLENHKLLSIPDPVLDNLRELTRFRADMVKERTALVNQLHETLATLYPELGQVLANLDSPTCLALLIAYPGPEYISRAGEVKVAEILAEVSRGRTGKVVAKALLEAAQNTIGVLQRQPALAIKVSILGQRLIALTTAVEKVEREIAKLFKKLPYDPKDFPVGTISSLAALISEIENIHRFPTLKQFLSHFGWCPQSFQTGGYNREHPRMSHAGNKYVRRLIWMLSIVSIRIVPRYRAYFQRRVAEGKSKMHIIVAVGRKLLSVLYAILKKGIPFDPNWEVNCQFALARH
jgi:transposase